MSHAIESQRTQLADGTAGILILQKPVAGEYEYGTKVRVWVEAQPLWAEVVEFDDHGRPLGRETSPPNLPRKPAYELIQIAMDELDENGAAVVPSLDGSRQYDMRVVDSKLECWLDGELVESGTLEDGDVCGETGDRIVRNAVQG